ncbi:hypothetical protein BDM02DRAFT_3086407 [Thelephora ganbajun]|uniref:Uncharacterized protein n=1 Tax=Thelephora ganbajun TaxID=370292 RepID=A0ACB6ZWX9_THEGA|nr:hypothetical protein BDM02DRAFT_3086407 [Thelephora ganbajun]
MGEVEFPISLPEVALVTEQSENFGLNTTFDAQWSNLTPKQTMGFVFHPRTKKFYSVAFYHQMHCLNALRKYIAKGNNLTLSYAVITHTEHCLDYLREALSCHSDITLEPVREVRVDENGAPAKEGSTGVHVTKVAMGWGVTHRCRDWGSLRGYMIQNWNDWPDKYKQASGMTH